MKPQRFCKFESNTGKIPINMKCMETIYLTPEIQQTGNFQIAENVKRENF